VSAWLGWLHAARQRIRNEKLKSPIQLRLGAHYTAAGRTRPATWRAASFSGRTKTGGQVDIHTEQQIRKFWAWLLASKPELDGLASPDHEFWDVLLAQLRSIDGKLCFEISAAHKATRELVITAQGDVDLFPLVEAIGAQAPPLPGWTVVALKQPMGFDFAMRYEGVKLDPAEIWFEPLVDPDHPEVLGLRIAAPGFTEEQEPEFSNGLLILLDTALGERSAATDIELVEVCELPTLPDDEGFILLPELMNYIEWRRHHLGLNGQGPGA
jgi:hypothetical protein